MSFWFFVLQVVGLIIPAGVANMAPVLSSRTFKFLAKPVDLNKTFRGIRIFGDHKTWRGVIIAPLAGLLIFYLQRYLYQFGFFEELSFFNYESMSPLFGLMLGLGAIVGDLIKSFFTRQMKIKPGKSWFPFDQIDWILGAFVFALPLYVPTLPMIAVAIFAGIVLHILTNLIGYALKIKKDLL